MIKVNPGKRGKYSNAHVGRYIPLNTKKYVGAQLPIYKSELERLCMAYLDKNPQIVSWGYESQYIKYYDSASGKVRRYYIDFVAVAKVGNLQQKIWIEIKTKEETVAPKNKKNYKAVATFMTNQCKWEAARKLATSKGYKFVILTEEQLKP